MHLSLRCLGILSVLLLLAGTPKFLAITGNDAGGSTLAATVSLSVALSGLALVTIRAGRVSQLGAKVVSKYPLRSIFILVNVGLAAWLCINVMTRLGIVFLLFALGFGLLAIAIPRAERITEMCITLVRLLPLSIMSLYAAMFAFEVFLWQNPLLVGGGGGGNPALPQIYEGLYSLNSNGFRGKELQANPNRDTVRILMLGDSFTFGQGVAEHETYPNQLASLLNSSGAKYEIINAGRSGTDTFDQLEQLRSTGLSLQPDLVTVQFFLNDLEPRMQATGDGYNLVDRLLMRPANTSYAVFFLKYRFECLRSRLSGDVDASNQWIDQITKDIESNGPGWQRFGEAVDGFSRIKYEHNIPIVFFLLPRPGVSAMSDFQTVHRAVRRRIQKAGIGASDFVDVWSNLPRQQQIVSEMDHHPSAKAHRLTANRLAREIRDQKAIASRIQP